MNRGVNGDNAEPSLGLDGEAVSRVNPLYQDPNEGVYGIHNRAAESYPHADKNRQSVGGRSISSHVAHEDRRAPLPREQTQPSRNKKSKFGLFNNKQSGRNYDRQSSGSSRSSVSSKSSVEDQQHAPQRPASGLFGFFSGRRPASDTEKYRASQSHNYNHGGAVPLHSKDLPIKEDDPEALRKRCWLIIKTIIVLFLLVLMVMLLIVVLVTIKDRTFDDEKDLTTPATEEPPPRFEAVTVLVSMVLSRPYLNAYNVKSSAERWELEREYTTAINTIFSETYLGDELLWVEIIEISEDDSEYDCTYILSRLVYSKDIVEPIDDGDEGFVFTLSELLKVKEDTQRIILDDASKRDGEIKKLDVKPFTIIIDAATLETVPVRVSTTPVASTTEPVSQDSTTMAASSTTEPPITQRSTTKQPTGAPSTTEQLPPTTKRSTTAIPTEEITTPPEPTTELITTERVTEGPCPPGIPLVNCLINPCDVTYCYLYPDAICIPDYCGGCNANFYDWSTSVLRACWNPCYDGNPPVNCLVNPCEVNDCPLRPDAICRANNCGGCNAEFYDPTNGYLVVCQDITPPVVECPDDTSEPINPWQAGRPVTFDITQARVTDDIDGNNIQRLIFSQNSGDFFFKGVTTVTVTAWDSSSNFGHCTFEVNVYVSDTLVTFPIDRPDPPTRHPPPPLVTTTQPPPTTTTQSPIDSEPPELECPASINRNTDGGRHYATVEWPVPTARDNVDQDVSVTTDIASGSQFPLGFTLVTVTARDDAGNLDTCTFLVNVNDREAPVLICPTVMSATTVPGREYASVTLPSRSDIFVTDNSRNPTMISDYAIERDFNVGETKVPIEATDGSGNVGRCVITVTVNAFYPVRYYGTAVLDRLYSSGAYGDVTSADYMLIKNNFETGVLSILPGNPGLYSLYQGVHVYELHRGEGANAGKIIVDFVIGYASIPNDADTTLASDTTSLLEFFIVAFDPSLLIIPGSINGNVLV